MNLNITGIDVEITEPLREYVSSKIHKLTHYFSNITNSHVTLSVDKLRHIAKADLHLALKQIHATSEAPDMYEAIDFLMDKLKKQVIKHKEELEGN